MTQLDETPTQPPERQDVCGRLVDALEGRKPEKILSEEDWKAAVSEPHVE